MKINRKIYQNLIAIFVLCIVLFAVLIFAFFQMYLQRESNSEIDRIVNQLTQRVNNITSEAENLCNILSKNYDIQAMIRTEASVTLSEIAKERTNINGKIAMIVQSFSSYNKNIALYLFDGRKFKHSDFSMKYEHDDTLAWSRQMLQDEDTFQWLGFFPASQALHSLEWPCFIGIVGVKSIATDARVGVLIVEIDTDVIVKSLVECVSDRLYTVSQEGEKIIFTLGRSTLFATKVKKDLMVNDHFQIEVHMTSSLVRDVGLIMVLLTVGLFIVFSFIMLLSTKSMSKSISKPIEKLLFYIENVQGDRFNTQLLVQTDILEIRQLVDSFQQMEEKIRQAMKNLAQEQRMIRKAQVSALQAQINPHFLYNTLDSISWLIRIGDSKKASDTLNSFSKLFRLSISNDVGFVTFRDELLYISNYISILNVRYNNQIDYRLEVQDESILEYYSPKLILQPLVENAIEHGISAKDSQQGTIQVVLTQADDGVEIKIHDDGVGIEPKKLYALNQRLVQFETDLGNENHNGYGIFNVNRRLKLSFGKQYGLYYQSALGDYTIVTVRFPRCDQKGRHYAD